MHVGRTPRFPICFLTNGGGVTEQQKADELSSWLGVQVKENQARTHGPRCRYNILKESTSFSTQISAASKGLPVNNITMCLSTCPIANSSSIPRLLLATEQR